MAPAATWSERWSTGGLGGVLHAAAVLGRRFDWSLLPAVTGLERLHLSPRTVEKHVDGLLAKTGCRRRAQLAGYSARLSG